MPVELLNGSEVATQLGSAPVDCGALGCGRVAGLSPNLEVSTGQRDASPGSIHGDA